MKFSVVIPTYNHCDDLLKPCIEKIFEFTDMADVELIISANGCTDGTKWYLDSLSKQFNEIGFGDHFKIAWNDMPLGYSKATNEGIKLATADRIVLFNNDNILLGQEKNRWLKMLGDPFLDNEKMGITAFVKDYSDCAGHEFAIFSCVMIHRRVFDTIGLLSEEYGMGAGEDTEFCIEAERAGYEVIAVCKTEIEPSRTYHVGDFPLWHKGEGTVHDTTLVSGWEESILDNSLTLARKYNKVWYKYRLSDNYTRHVFLKDEEVSPRERARYQWAANKLIGNRVLDIGCSTGYGSQYFADDVEYTGVDNSKIIIDCAKLQNWKNNLTFIHEDINNFPLDYYDTIILFETMVYMENGLELVERLKSHCKRLLIAVPRLESVGFWGEHHKLHNLSEDSFPGFEFKYIDEVGNIVDGPVASTFSLMLCMYSSPEAGI